MSNIVSLMLPEVRAALSPMPGGATRRGTDTVPQPVPSWWLTAIGSATLNESQELLTAELHIWESSRERLDSAIESVAFMNRYETGGTQITVRKESMVRAQEDVSTHHATLTVAAKVYPGVVYG